MPDRTFLLLFDINKKNFNVKKGLNQIFTFKALIAFNYRAKFLYYRFDKNNFGKEPLLSVTTIFFHIV